MERFQIAMKTLAVTLLTIVQVARKPTPIIVAMLTRTVHIPPRPTPQSSSSSVATINQSAAVTPHAMVSVVSYDQRNRVSRPPSQRFSNCRNSEMRTEAPIRRAIETSTGTSLLSCCLSQVEVTSTTGSMMGIHVQRVRHNAAASHARGAWDAQRAINVTPMA
jgi:hypothetical protein